MTTLDKEELKPTFVNSKKLNEQPDKPQDPKSERNKYFSAFDLKEGSHDLDIICMFCRFNLQFVRDSFDELRKMKKDSLRALEYHDDKELEIDIEDYYKPGSPLDMPLRPKWSYDMSKQQLEANENKYFEVGPFRSFQ